MVVAIANVKFIMHDSLSQKSKVLSFVSYEDKRVHLRVKYIENLLSNYPTENR
jgi:hypothetical protein